MIVYRISDCKYICDLSGMGAYLFGGRWHSVGTYVVYIAQSRSLALLENVVHWGRIKNSVLCTAEIEIPDNSITTLTIADLPDDWASNPSPDRLKMIGDNFIKAGKHLVLKIPSSLVMEEHNYLINPNHTLFTKVKILTNGPIKIDERLFH
jgi:RES domain-containing protein